MTDAAESSSARRNWPRKRRARRRSSRSATARSPWSSTSTSASAARPARSPARRCGPATKAWSTCGGPRSTRSPARARRATGRRWAAASATRSRSAGQLPDEARFRRGVGLQLRGGLLRRQGQHRPPAAERQSGLGPELGRGPGRRRVPEQLLLLPAAHLQPLHEPGLPRGLPAQRDLQARGGRHRPDQPGTLQGLPLLHGGLPVQEDLLQPRRADSRRSASSASRASRRASRRPARGSARAACASSASSTTRTARSTSW